MMLTDNQLSEDLVRKHSENMILYFYIALFINKI